MTEEKKPMDKKLTKQISVAMMELLKASALIKEGEAIKDRVKEETMPLLIAHDLTEAAIPGLGKMAIRTSSGSSIDKTKLTTTLLHEGVDPNRIQSILEKSTNSWSKEYLDFRVK